jgi:hypothetical protein
MNDLTRAFVRTNSALLDKEIIDLVVGDDRDFEADVSGIPEDAELQTAWLTIKLNEEDDDSAAVVQKSITAEAEDGVGQITETGSSASTGHLVFQLTHEDTAELEAGVGYYYDIRVRTDTGKTFTVEHGRLIPRSAITRDVEPAS